MTKQEEFDVKLERVRGFLHKAGYGGALFGDQYNFSWLSCGGDDQIIRGTELGFVNVLVTIDDAYLVSNNIEMPRIKAEETAGVPFKTVEYIWTGSMVEDIKEIVRGQKLAADFGYPGAENESARLGLLRVPLLESEVERFRELGRMCSSAMDETMLTLKPGMDEFEIQGLIGGKLLAKGIIPVVLLVGTDERIFNFRHPMPTSKKLDRYCMIVICAQKWGLILSMTRLVHLGQLPNEVQKKYDSLHRVEMAYITSTVPGSRIKDVFSAGSRVYAGEGYPGEELKHFQGGTCGYLTREQGLTPDGEYTIQDGEIFAHNPTIQGTKLEDSILVRGTSFEVLSLSDAWPAREIEYNKIVLKRPEILVR
jgi:Xaa-Pro dipeptidase